MVPPIRKFRIRFSLRSLLLLTAILGAGLGWLVYKINVYQVREAAIVSLEEVGVCVLYDYEVDNSISSQEPPSPSWLRY